MESALRDDPALTRSAARSQVLSNLPESVAPGVLAAAGLDPATIMGSADEAVCGPLATGRRSRDPGWRSAVLQAWDRQCAFCGYDGQIAEATAGIDAAHVRLVTFDGPG